MPQIDVPTRTRTGRSLNIILWFTFSVFALAIILIYGLAQNIFVHKQYREQTVEVLMSAGERMAEAISLSVNDSSSLALQLYSIANSNGVRLYVLYETGESVFPEYTEQRIYSEKTALLKQILNGSEAKAFEEDSLISYGAAVTVNNRPCFLYLSTPADVLNENVGAFRWMSLITGLFAVVLAFLASGFVAVLITKPVSEVTERAKELARGNFQLNFKRNYYCAEISELSDALEYARDEISKADQMQKELIANVSHDFKTPLTMIKAYASMIREISGEDKEKRDAHAQIIIDESDRLAALVGDLLDLSKLRASFTDEQTVFNLSDEVYRIAERFEYLKETDGYEITAEVDDEIYTHASRERIEQVLYNLIGNAVNYTGEDKRVRIRLVKNGEGSRFEVIDSGKGIAPQELDTIWDRYYRSNRAHKRPVQGTGLGLSIVKSILMAQGCPFGVISEVGKGSCFWVEFPPPEKSGETDKKRKGKRREEHE